MNRDLTLQIHGWSCSPFHTMFRTSMTQLLIGIIRCLCAEHCHNFPVMIVYSYYQVFIERLSGFPVRSGVHPIL